MARGQWNLPGPFVLGDGRVVLIRQMDGADIELAAEFLSGLSRKTSYMRFMCTRANSAIDARKWVEFDRDRAMALLAETTCHGRRREIAEVRCVRDSADSNSAELAVVVADDAQRQGLGEALLCAMSAFASSRGIALLHGTTLHENVPMRGLARKLGFTIRRSDADDRELCLERTLGPGRSVGACDRASSPFARRSSYAAAPNAPTR